MPIRDTSPYRQRMKHYLIGLMLKEELDCFVPLVYDGDTDVLIRKHNGEYIEVCIKLESPPLLVGSVALFDKLRNKAPNSYYFVFYHEKHDSIFIISAEEALSEFPDKTEDKNKSQLMGLVGTKTNPDTDEKENYIVPRFKKYFAKDFSRFK